MSIHLKMMLQVVAGRFDDFDVLVSRIPAKNHSQVPKCQYFRS